MVVSGVEPNTGIKVATFEIKPKTLTAEMVSLSEAPLFSDGTPKTPAVQVADGTPSILSEGDYAVAYENNVNAGEARAIVTGKGNYTGLVELPFTILGGSFDTTVEGHVGTYDGQGHGITVTATGDGVEILYAASENGPYAPSVPLYTNVCSTATWFRLSAPYHVTVTNFAPVTIAPKQLTDAMVTLAESAYVYDGTEKRPAVTVADGEPSILDETDYDVTYAENVGAGTAHIVVTGKGNYGGEVTKDFTIARADQAYEAAGHVGEYDGQAHGISVSSTAPGAAVTYALEENGPYSSETVAFSNVCAETVWFRIEATNFLTVVDCRMVEITARALTEEMVSLPQTEFAYDGTEKCPAVSVADGDPSLIGESDIRIQYVNNVEPGQASVIVTGCGNYAGTVYRSFVITKTDSTEPDWRPVAQGDTMLVFATVYDCGRNEHVAADDSILAAFDANGVCRGVTRVADGPVGRYYQLSVGIASADESGFVLKVWDAQTGKISEVIEPLACNAEKQVGDIDAPQTYTVGSALQEITLGSGWNWISLNVVPATATPAEVFADVSFADDDVILTADGIVTYYDGQWYPADFQMRAGVAYMVKKSTAGEATARVYGALMADGVEVSAGWNWFGPSTSSSRPITSVVHSGGFSDKDVVKGATSSTVYYGGSWYPSSFVFTPGTGYKARFAKGGVLGFDGRVKPLLRRVAAGANVAWTQVKQENVGIVYVSVTNRTMEAGSKMALFAVDGECRGVANLQQGPKCALFAFAAGVVGVSETMTAKVCTADGTVLDCDNELTVNTTAPVGSITEPVGLGVAVETSDGTVLFVTDAETAEPVLKVQIEGVAKDLRLAGEWTNCLERASLSPDTFNAMGKNGIPVWQSYVLGVDPREEKPVDQQIQATIEIGSDGVAEVRCVPDASTDPNRSSFVEYVTLGKPTLDGAGGWSVVTESNRTGMRFFKIQIKLK